LSFPPALLREGRSVFWEIIVSVILSKKVIWTCVLFRTVSEIEPFDFRHSTAGREGWTIVGPQTKPLYSQMAVSRKPFRIGHMFI
jgi:hypothetical protein